MLYNYIVLSIPFLLASVVFGILRGLAHHPKVNGAGSWFYYKRLSQGYWVVGAMLLTVIYLEATREVVTGAVLYGWILLVSAWVFGLVVMNAIARKISQRFHQ